MASIDKVDNVAKASIAKINDVPVANIEAINQTPWTALPQPFVMEIDSTNLTAQTMTLGLQSSGSYNFDVDWGDGSPVTTITVYNSPDATHVYSASQKYTITLQPNTPTGLVEYAFGISPNNEHDAYTEIISWGDMNISLGTTNIFYDCSNLNWNTATAGIPKFKSRVIITNSLFRDCDALTADLSGWGTASDPISGNFQEIFFLSKPPSSPNLNFVANNITSLSSAFSACDYNAPLNNWDTSACVTFASCFNNNQVFNQPLDAWDVSGVTSSNGMSSMFQNARAFNQNIDNWTISPNATDFTGIFSTCSSFNQPLNSWNVSNVTRLSNAFLSCSVFNQDLNNWDVSNVTLFSQTFYNCSQFNGNVSTWNTANGNTMYRMFRNCSSFSGNLDSWNVGNVTQFRDMFWGASSFRGALSAWNTSSATSMREMFVNCPNDILDARNWNVQNVTDFYRTFFNGSIGFDLLLWKVYSATNMTQFATTGAGSFTDQQCEDAFVAWSNDPLTATNVNATNIWGSRTYPIGGAMQTATIKLTGATYNWTVTGLTFV